MDCSVELSASDAKGLGEKLGISTCGAAPEPTGGWQASWARIVLNVPWLSLLKHLTRSFGPLLRSSGHLQRCVGSHAHRHRYSILRARPLASEREKQLRMDGRVDVLPERHANSRPSPCQERTNFHSQTTCSTEGCRFLGLHGRPYRAQYLLFR